MSTLDQVKTPALLVDLAILDRNLRRMQERADEFQVALRPHVKTHKCVEIARRQLRLGARGITVSTLYEARVFAAHGFADLTWAFPLILGRLDQALALAEEVTLRFVVDSSEAIDALESSRRPLHVWLKIDCGYHRAGVDPSGGEVLELAARLARSPSLLFDGLLTHSGHAYDQRSLADLTAIASQERSVMVATAERLAAEGIASLSVSVGSTPAMSAIDDLRGVSEIRPGNYALHDDTQVHLGSCQIRDCAATVLTSVVSSNRARRSVVDAGALALSKDLGPWTSEHPVYGRVYSDYPAGRLEGGQLVSLSQEHGVVDVRYPVGTRLRILPNHSCLTVAQFDELVVVDGDRVLARWKVWRGRD